LIQSSSHEDANIIWGFVVDDALKGDMLITVIATGFSTRPIVLARTDKENDVIRELKTAGERLIDYDRPAYLRKQEQHKEKEHVKLGMVVDDSVLDMEAYNIPTFLRKKAD
jgi:cell division protein FtsZ